MAHEGNVFFKSEKFHENSLREAFLIAIKKINNFFFDFSYEKQVKPTNWIPAFAGDGICGCRHFWVFIA